MLTHFNQGLNHWHPHWLNFSKAAEPIARIWIELFIKILDQRNEIFKFESSTVSPLLFVPLAPCFAMKTLAETQTWVWTFPHRFVPVGTSPNLLDLRIATQQLHPGTGLIGFSTWHMNQKLKKYETTNHIDQMWQTAVSQPCGSCQHSASCHVANPH